MKGLIWNCKKVSWNTSGKRLRGKTSCLLVYVCCETGDGTKEISEAARRVLQLNKKRYRNSSVLIMPFAHLSNLITEKEEALNLLTHLKLKLSGSLEATLLPFDKDKRLIIDLFPTNKDVSFFSY